VRKTKSENQINKEAAPGDRVGHLFVVREGIDSLYQLPDYDIAVDSESGSGRMFEVRDNWLYLTDEYSADAGDYEITLKVTDKSTGETATFEQSLTKLAKSQSEEQRYPDFRLDETREEAEFTYNDEAADSEAETKPGKSPIIPIIAVAAGIAAVAAGAIIVSKKKKKK